LLQKFLNLSGGKEEEGERERENRGRKRTKKKRRNERKREEEEEEEREREREREREKEREKIISLYCLWVIVIIRIVPRKRIVAACLAATIAVSTRESRIKQRLVTCAQYN